MSMFKVYVNKVHNILVFNLIHHRSGGADQNNLLLLPSIIYNTQTHLISKILLHDQTVDSVPLFSSFIISLCNGSKHIKISFLLSY